MGRLRYVLEIPAHARGALDIAASAYEGVELHDLPEDEPVEEPIGRGTVARIELVLARASTQPLRLTGIKPDPLAGFARAMTDLHFDRGSVRRSAWTCSQ